MTKVSQKGQVTIPKEIREKLGIHPGDEVRFEEEEDGRYVLRKSAENPFEEWRGAGNSDRSVDEQMRDLRGERDR